MGTTDKYNKLPIGVGYHLELSVATSFNQAHGFSTQAT